MLPRYALLFLGACVPGSGSWLFPNRWKRVQRLYSKCAKRKHSDVRGSYASMVFICPGCVVGVGVCGFGLSCSTTRCVRMVQDLIGGLNERPLPAEIRARDFDVSLRALDLGDVETASTPSAPSTVGTGSLLLAAPTKWDPPSTTCVCLCCATFDAPSNDDTLQARKQVHRRRWKL